MSPQEYVIALREFGCAKGNKGVIENKDGTTTLIYAVKDCVDDLFLSPDTLIGKDQVI